MGARKIGKTSLLKYRYPNAKWIDLLKSDEYARFVANPSLLREVDLTPDQLTVIDEVQKIPQLLDEVHWLIENRGIKFALCGSSARKLRRGHSNLLGGRALRFELRGFVYPEIRNNFDLNRLLNTGYLPDHYIEDGSYNDIRPVLRAYVSDYLKEEIAAKGLVRNLAKFNRFLEVAALADTEMINFSNFAREYGVSSQTVRDHFQILEDTLLGTFIPAYVRRIKRRVVKAPKFYFHDVGPVNILAKRGELIHGSELYGKAFENYLVHELCSYRAYRQPDLEISYLRDTSGNEVEIVLNDCEVLLEIKSASKIHDAHLKGIRKFIGDNINSSCRRKLVVSNDPIRRRTEDSVEIIPIKEFLEELWGGGVV